MHLLEQVLLGPRGERSLVVLGLRPQDFDEVELRAVRRQKQQDETVSNHPLFQGIGVYVMVNAGVVQDHHGELVACRVAGLLAQKIQQILAADAVLMHLKRQRSRSIVQCTQYVDTLASHTGIGTVGLAQWRPAALYVGHVANTGFIKVKQLHFLVLFFGRLTQLVQALLHGFKALLISFFLATAGCACTTSLAHADPLTSGSG